MDKYIFDQFTATETAPMKEGPLGLTTHQAIVKGTGALTATIIQEGTNDQSGLSGWTTIVTFTLSGNDEVSDSVVLQHAWARYRSRCTVLTGTGKVAKSIMQGVR